MCFILTKRCELEGLHYALRKFGWKLAFTLSAAYILFNYRSGLLTFNIILVLINIGIFFF